MRSVRPARLGNVVEPRVLGMESQRNERLETARLVLQLAQPAQVIDPVPRLFDVPVQHRRVGPQPELVGFAMNVQPVLRVGLVLADPVADFGMKNLGPAAGHAPKAGADHLLEHPARRLFGEEAEPVDFDAGPGLDVQFGPGLVDHAHDVHVPVERLLMVQAADDVNFGRPGALASATRSRIMSSVNVYALRRLQVRAERAEHAAIDADVGGVEVDVRVVIREIPVLPFANDVRQPSQRQHVDLSARNTPSS